MPTRRVETYYTYTPNSKRVSAHGIIALCDRLLPIDYYPYQVAIWGDDAAEPFSLMWSPQEEAWLYNRTGEWVKLRNARRYDRRLRRYAEDR